MDNENKLMMNSLNPKESVKKDVSRQLFPPDEDAFYRHLQSDEFNKFMVKDATTSEGRNAIAKYFGVDEEWENYKSTSTPVEQYFQLLLLVKTKSKTDTLWISFIEGLHRHAAIVMGLLCSRFDF